MEVEGLCRNVKGGGDGEVQCVIGGVLWWWALLVAADNYGGAAE